MNELLQRAIERVRERSWNAIEVCERFTWFETRLHETYSTLPPATHFQSHLHPPITRPSQRERALVALAIHPDEQTAKRILSSYLPPPQHPELSRFHQLALWKRGISSPPLSSPFDASA